MTNSKNTKKSLYASALALLLCFVMLIGTTFAWFTDSASTGVNTITAGNLKVGMYYADGQNDVPAENEGWTDAKNDQIFNYTLWEPGYTVARHIKIANEGNLALKYKVDFAVENPGTLAEVIDVYFVDPAEKIENRAALSDLTPVGTLAKVLAGGVDLDGSLAALKSDTFTIVLKMQESAGNAYKNATVGDLTIHLRATQDTVESDSFGSNYDANAEMDLLPTERRATNDATLTELLKGDLTGVDTIYLGAGKYNAFNFENRTCTNLTLIGAVDADGNPATTIYTEEIPANNDGAGVWENSKNFVVKNIIFEAKNGIEGDRTATYQNALNIAHGATSTFENCKFVNQGVMVTNGANFKNCAFEGNNSGYRAICLYPSGTAAGCNVLIEDCEISGYTCGINAQEAGSSTITIKNSTVSSLIEVGALKALVVDGSTLNCYVVAWFAATNVTIPDGSFGTGFTYTNNNL